MDESEWKKIEELKPLCLTTRGGFACDYEKCPVEECPFTD